MQIVILLFLFIILFGFSFARDLQIFVPILNQVLLLVYISFTYLSILAISEFQKWQLTESNTEKVMIIMIFAYDMNSFLTEIRIEMEDTTQFQRCLFQAMAFETVLIQIFGITNSLLFQSNTKQSIITNFQEEFKHNYQQKLFYQFQ
ncbi:unnamed protein product [Paramecium pentaurelia]|uniref:Amino acid transporter transmembrane domain-containing protein n=1 Tax=Paramecium pentaurelia TaxID=43138 RepID=A0A8S1XTH1_9CILI|nr:unnamed protein product [Paramecium pentaurelia]